MYTMASIPIQGEIKWSQLRDVFGGSNPVKLSNYYQDSESGLCADVEGMPVRGQPLRLNVIKGKSKTATVSVPSNYLGNTSIPRFGAKGGAGSVGYCKLDNQWYVWSNNLPVEFTPSLPSNETIATMITAFNTTLTLTTSGNVYSWGTGTLGNGLASSTIAASNPYLIPFSNNDKIKYIAAGNGHYGAISASNRVYMWGSRATGQLGSNYSTNVLYPKLVDGLSNVNVTMLALCGTPPGSTSGHSLALTDDGDVYAWGHNTQGQLGLSNTTSPTYTPTKIQFPGGIKIKNITAGSGFSTAITTSNQLYAWGGNTYGQLGLGFTGSVLNYPQLVPSIAGNPTIVDVFAGYGTYPATIALSSTGNVYSYGSGVFGTTATGSAMNCNVTPCNVSIPNNAQITSISYHNQGSVVALSTSGDVYAWGSSGTIGYAAGGSNGFIVREMTFPAS